MTDDTMLEIAEEIVSDLRHCINMESQFIEKEHELHIKLCAIDNVWAHLQETIPIEMDHLQTLNHTIYESILEIRQYIDENELTDIGFVKETEKNLKKLEADIKHRDYQAVRSDSDLKPVRVGIFHLKELHQKFISLLEEMKENKLIQALKDDVGENKQREEYGRQEEYFFHQIYKFISTYEVILQHLLEKERILYSKIEKDVQE